MKIIKAQNLACPIDGMALKAVDMQLCCESGHSYDVARQGYVHLLPVQSKRSKNPGDSKEMVVARTSYLNSGVYEPIAKELQALVAQYTLGRKECCLLDAGCGEGYYLDYIQQHLNAESINLIGLDISKPAVLAAAKRNKEISWIVGTNRQPPIIENSVDIIICVFGFQSFDGFKKILRPDGVIIIVEPGARHLMELKEVIYSGNIKEKNESELEHADYSLADSQTLKFKTGELNKAQIENLLLMTPHLFRATKEGKEAASKLETLNVSADIAFKIFKKNSATEVSLLQ